MKLVQIRQVYVVVRSKENYVLTPDLSACRDAVYVDVHVQYI